MNVFSIFGRLALDDKDYQSGLRGAESATTKSATSMAAQLKKVGDAATTLGKGMSTFITGPILAVTGAAIASAIAVGNYADKILDLAEQTGLSTDRLQAFEQVAIEAGVATDTLSRAAIGLQRQLSSGDEDAGKLRDALAGLGISSRTASGELRSMDDMLPEIISSLASVTDVTQRNALANEIFGRSAVDLIPVLALGADQIDALSSEAISLGKVLSIDALQAANQFRIEQQRLTDTIQRTWREVSVALLPVISQLVAAIEQHVVPGIQSFVNGLVGLIGFFQSLSPLAQGTLTTIAVLLAAAGPVLLGLGNLLTIIPKITAAFTVLRTVVLALSGPTGVLLLAGAAAVGLAMRFFGNRDSLAVSVDKAAERTRAFAKTLGDVNDAESLAKNVQILANMIGPANSTGRTAFVNYANQIIATSTDSKAAFERIKVSAFETANAVQIAALRMQASRIQANLAMSEFLEDPTDRIEAFTESIEDNFAHQRRLIEERDRASGDEKRRLQGLLTAAISAGDQLQDELTHSQNLLTEYQKQGADSLAAATARAKAQLGEIELNIQMLSGAVETGNDEVGKFSATISTTLVPNVNTLGTSATDAVDKIATLRLAVFEYLRTLNLVRDMEAVSLLSPLGSGAPIAETERFVSVLVEAQVQLLSTAEAAQVLARQYLASQAAQDAATAASIAARAELTAMQAASMSASSGVNDFADAALRARDNANEMEAGLAGSNAELRQTPVEALASANALLDYMRVQQRLGRATEDDVNRALINQANALRNVMQNVTPLTPAYTNAANALADLQDGLRNNESALLDQMSRVEENTAEYAALEEQLLRIQALMGQLGLGTGGPGVGADIKEAAETVITGVEALRKAVDAQIANNLTLAQQSTFLGKNLGTFANAIIDITSKFPLFASALEGFVVVLNKEGEIIRESFDPIKMLVAMFVELFTSMDSFRELVGFVNQVLNDFAQRAFEPIIHIFRGLFEVLAPIVGVFGELLNVVLKPLVMIWDRVLGPLLRGVAEIIRNVFNFIAPFIGAKKIPKPGANDGAKKTGPRVLSISDDRVQFAGLTESAFTIAGQQQQLRALQEFQTSATTQRDRDLARKFIEMTQRNLDSMLGREAQQDAPVAPVTPPRAGSIEALRAEANELSAERARTTNPSRLAQINNRLAAINAEIQRLEAIGLPVDSTPAPGQQQDAPPPPGTIAALEEERRALQAQLLVAQPAAIPALNLRIAELNEQITRLRNLGFEEGIADAIEQVAERTLDPFSFGNTPQAVQLAVATPLVEASERMLDAANVMNSVFGSMLPGGQAGFGALPPFTSAIERMTPVLERLLAEGVSVMMGQAQAGPTTSPTAFLRGV